MKLFSMLARILSVLEQLQAGNKNVLSIQESARYLNVSESMLYGLTRRRVLKHSKPSGKIIFIAREHLEEWALSNKVSTLDELSAISKARKSKS